MVPGLCYKAALYFFTENPISVALAVAPLIPLMLWVDNRVAGDNCYSGLARGFIYLIFSVSVYTLFIIEVRRSELLILMSAWAVSFYLAFYAMVTANDQEKA